MSTLRERARTFLAQSRIAVCGVSRDPKKGVAANIVYKKLKETGHQVFAVNPNADTVEGDRCYPDLRSIPGGAVDGVVIGTRPETAEAIVRECIDLGIGRVWMHRSFGRGSVSPEAVKLGEDNGIDVIAGGCPMMFCEPVDIGHRCMRWLLGVTGKLPAGRHAA